MLERNFLVPDDMWKRVENGHLLYAPIVTVKGKDHAHVYIAGQLPREPTGEIVGKGDMTAQIRKVCENIGKGLAHVGATFDDVVRGTTYVTDMRYRADLAPIREEFFGTKGPASTLVEISALAHPDWMIEIEAIADGTTHAIAYWYELQLDETTMLTTKPGQAKLSGWKQAVQLLSTPKTLRRGEKFKLFANHDMDALWFDL